MSDHTDAENTEEGLPDRLKIKRRPYTMSQAALEARRMNAQRSTGPTTEEGKRRASRNAWKHGAFAQSRILGLGKPCTTSCPQYPCSIVDAGQTSPGEDCLDKQHLVEACLAIERALKNQDFDSLNDLVVMELGENIQIIRELRRAVLEDGVVVKSEKYDKDGKVLGYEIKPHPALLALPKLQNDFGFTLPEFRLTPRELQKSKDTKEAAKTLAEIMAGANQPRKE